MNKKTRFIYIGIFGILLGLIAASGCLAEDSLESPYNKACSSTKTGRLVISPTSLQFYVNQEQLENPQPIVVQLSGFALPNCTDANCTTEKMEEFTYDANGTINGTIPRSDDPTAHNVIWPETLAFCWMAAPTEQWIKMNGQDAGLIVQNADGNQTLSVTIDVKRLVDGYAYSESTVKEGWIQITTTIHDPSIPGSGADYMRKYVDDNIKTSMTATLSDWGIAGTVPIDDQISTWWIPVKVYINSLRYAQQENLATTDWMDLTLNVPVMDNTRGALYILAEHPSLAPGQVFAYRWIDGKPQFDLFSEWGHAVKDAEKLYYAENIQNTPIALPFSSDTDASSVIPYRAQNVGMSANVTDIKAFIPVPFGGGIRLIGMEGDWIIRALVGDPRDIQNYNSWRELLYYVLHIRPITGRWLVTENNMAGDSFTYVDDSTGIIYPMNLNEERGQLSGVWITPNAQTVLAVNYADNGDQVCNTFSIQGHRVVIDNCVKPGSYEIYFSQATLWGLFEYYYRIDEFDIDTGGKIAGIWKYRPQGEDWTLSETFTAITQDVVVPLDPSCNCYRVAGKVNGIATPFIVDTGANTVLLNLNDAEMYGLTDANGTISSELCTAGTADGIGGSITGYFCPVSIEIDGVLTMQNVSAFLSANQDTALLGMTFLKNFHVSTNAPDGTMVISR